MDDSPRVSVIIATYNWSNVLRYAIESVLWQTFEDFELLVIGDGCTDDSAEVVASFHDPRIRWHNLPENSGHQSAPNNAGIAFARGEFIAYLGHDDLWYPTHLAALVRALSESGASVAYSWLEMIWPPATGFRLMTGISTSSRFEPGIIIPPSSLMHRRDLCEQIGYWSDYRAIPTAPDADFLERAYDAGARFIEVKELSVFKFNASARPDCYREKPFREQAEYVARIRAEPDFLLRELTTFIDLNVRRHPEDISRGAPRQSRNDPPGAGQRLSRVIRGLEEREISEPRFHELRKGRIDLGSAEAEPFLWYGWSHAEGSFRWTDGKEAALTFSAAAAKPSRLMMSFAPFLAPGKVDVQRIEIFLNDQALRVLHLSKLAFGEYALDFPPSSLKRENVIQFVFTHAVSPVMVAVNTDVRKLAMQVAWIEFE